MSAQIYALTHSVPNAIEGPLSRKTAGIVAEFNPFHNGHAALVSMARSNGATHIVAVMSGNYVQRGTAAITDKRVRAHAALVNGVDLVVELPLPFATAPAQHFARGAISILQSTGCVDVLCFGSECGNAERLGALAQAVDSPLLQPHLQDYLSQGITFARARELAVGQVFGQDFAALLSTPNNALAVEYLRQAANLGWRPKVMTFLRRGVEHDGDTPSGKFSSASYLRRLLAEQAPFCLDGIRPFVPLSAYEIYNMALLDGALPSCSSLLESIILGQLRRLSQDSLSHLPDLSEGLENRLYASIRKSGSLQALEQALKTKRYPLARIRRLILSAFLGVEQKDSTPLPPYIRVLGFNSRGQELLASMKQNCNLPVSTSLARLREMGGYCARLADLEELSTDLYALTLPVPRPCGYEFSAKAIIMENNN